MPLNVPFCSRAQRPRFPQVQEKNGGDDGTRTRDLCRDSVAWLGFTTTYKTAGTAKLRGSRTRHCILWVGLWVGKKPTDAGAAHVRFPEPRLDCWQSRIYIPLLCVIYCGELDMLFATMH